MAQGFRAIKNKDKLITMAKKMLKAGEGRGTTAKKLGVSELTLRRWLAGVGVKPAKRGRPRGTKSVLRLRKPMQVQAIAPTGRVGKQLVRSFLDAVVKWAKGQKKLLGR